jgi:hypothetical protein
MDSVVGASVAEHAWAEVGHVPGEVVASNVPLVLRGFVRDWPAVSSALQSNSALSGYLLSFDAGLPLTVYTSDSDCDRIAYKKDFSGFNFSRDSSTLKAVLEELSAGRARTLYVGSTQVDRWLPDFRRENDISINGVKPLVSFWLGSPVSVAAHYDCPANIACCVAGKRTFTLFPPEQVSNLYVGPLDLNPSGRAISLVDFDRPDYGKFPRFAEALDHAQVVELGPGDALFVPPLWWHHVKSSAQVNLLVNYWWKTTPDYSGNPELALEHAILALRGLPENQRQAWKALFEHYVFSEPDTAAEHIPSHIRGILDTKNENAVRRGWLAFAKKLRF